jgi:hypothetical protein
VTTRVIVKNDSNSVHVVRVVGVAKNYHSDPVDLAPGESHSQHVWLGFQLEVTELPPTVPANPDKDDVA